MIIENHPNGYGNVTDYIKWINHNFKLTNTLECFKFYTMQYDFATDKEKWEKLKFYDILPLFFVCQIFSNKKYCIGCNLHHIPVTARMEWLNKFREISDKINEIIPYLDYGKNRTDRFSNMIYPLVWKMMPKTKIFIRRYNFERIHYLRNVNLALLDEVSKFWSSTYLGVSIASINKRYLNYKPKK